MRAPTLYFAYGSNLSESGMRLRCPSARPDGPARLARWRLTFRGVANIEPAPGRTVYGALWWLNGADIASLDSYEGAPTFYRQRTVEVETDDGLRSAMTYVMPRPTYVGVPSDWYFERIHEGYERWDLPVPGLTIEDVLAGKAIWSDGRARLRPEAER